VRIASATRLPRRECIARAVPLKASVAGTRGCPINIVIDGSAANHDAVEIVEHVTIAEGVILHGHSCDGCAPIAILECSRAVPQTAAIDVVIVDVEILISGIATL